MWSSSGQDTTCTSPTEESGNTPHRLRTQRPSKSCSSGKPATRCPRNFLTRNLMTRPSAERSLPHCSFRSEKNQWPKTTYHSFEGLLQSVFFCVSFKFMQQRETKSRLWKRADQDSPWTEKILAGFRTEIQKHDLQKLSETIESQTEICPAHQGDERLRRDHRLRHEQLFEQNGDFREAHGGPWVRWKNWSDFKGPHSMNLNLREKDWSKTETQSLTHNRDSGTAEWSSLHAWFGRFKRCWISTQWTIPRSNQPAFFTPFRWGFHPWISNVSQHTSPHVMSERQNPESAVGPRCQSRPSARNSFDPNDGKMNKGLWCRPRTTADSGSSLPQHPHTINVCLLEDKIQDRGVYLFTISYGSNAVDQRSGVGWFSGWIEIFVINKRNFNVSFWSTWCEDCYSTEQNHPYLTSKKNQSGGTKSPEAEPFPSRNTDPRVLPGSWSHSVENHADRLQLLFEILIFRIRFEVGRNFLVHDENPT